MLRLENIPPEQMPEVVRIASELYTQDQEKEAEAQERQATVDAAAEIGLPESYLHRAAEELHARRVAQMQQRRRRRTGLLALAGATLLIGTGATVMTLRSHTPSTPTVTASAAANIVPPFNTDLWQINMNSGTQASAHFANNTAVLSVQRFTADSENHFTANLNSQGSAKNLAGFHTVSFHMHGTLPHMRLYLENGDERWRSPLLDVDKRGGLIRIDLRQFEHQTRSGPNASWQKVGYRPPEQIENLSFKAGWYVNDIQATGDVTLSDLHFE